MAISLRLSDEDANLIRQYAKINGITVSELVRQSVLERIEEEFDLKSYEKAIAAYRQNPITYSHEEVAGLLELE